VVSNARKFFAHCKFGKLYTYNSLLRENPIFCLFCLFFFEANELSLGFGQELVFYAHPKQLCVCVNFLPPPMRHKS